MSSPTPKQLVDLGGKAMLRWSVEAFDAHPQVDRLVVVLPADLLVEGATIVGRTARPCVVAAGGGRRQDSVRLGLAALADDVDVVLVHDAARPFVRAALIDRVIDEVRRRGAAVPAVAMSETVKRVDTARRTVTSTLRREEIWVAQTPQGFRRPILAEAVARGAGSGEATDEAMLAEQAGHEVSVVDGDPRNLKITTPDDLDRARAVLSAPRVGLGYDLHRLAPGRAFRLAGVLVPSDAGPVGHSDADVVCHALVDAIFGACGAGDIGQHFPDTDERWKDVPGLDLLARAVGVAAERGWRVSNADVTVILERPKLAPHVTAIRASLASVLAIDPGRISVKAKTNEGADAVGRGEAVAAQAVVILSAGTTW